MAYPVMSILGLVLPKTNFAGGDMFRQKAEKYTISMIISAGQQMYRPENMFCCNHIGSGDWAIG
eukprot:5413501-Ditylum_brightwellii.AAC.1